MWYILSRPLIYLFLFGEIYSCQVHDSRRKHPIGSSSRGDTNEWCDNGSARSHRLQVLQILRPKQLREPWGQPRQLPRPGQMSLVIRVSRTPCVTFHRETNDQRPCVEACSNRPPQRVSHARRSRVLPRTLFRRRLRLVYAGGWVRRSERVRSMRQLHTRDQFQCFADHRWDYVWLQTKEPSGAVWGRCIRCQGFGVCVAIIGSVGSICCMYLIDNWAMSTFVYPTEMQ